MLVVSTVEESGCRENYAWGGGEIIPGPFCHV